MTQFWVMAGGTTTDKLQGESFSIEDGSLIIKSEGGQPLHVFAAHGWSGIITVPDQQPDTKGE